MSKERRVRSENPRNATKVSRPFHASLNCEYEVDVFSQLNENVSSRVHQNSSYSWPFSLLLNCKYKVDQPFELAKIFLSDNFRLIFSNYPSVNFRRLGAVLRHDVKRWLNFLYNLSC